MVESQSTTGVGSIWNQNSWHWEEKNYSEQAKKYLEEELVKISVHSTNPHATTTLYEVKSVTGSASITIRKQKQIFLFEYTIDMYFKAVPDLEGEDEAKGTISIHEFN
jgi:activator of HSP90 ATPase